MGRAHLVVGCRPTCVAVTTTDPELDPPGIRSPRIGMFVCHGVADADQAGGELVEPACR
jgi:hypothetical protein